MILSSLNVLLFIGTVAAVWKKIPSGGHGGHQLLGRADCLFGTNCAECWGEGNVPCDFDTCYNPSGGEQCCNGGTFCFGDTPACCRNGPGLSLGTAFESMTGFPSGFSLPTTGFLGSVSVSATLTNSAPTAMATSWDCMSGDSDEDCCQRGGDDWHWCSGGWPNRVCYRPDEGEVCCSDDSVCNTGPDCCSGRDAVATTPSPRPPLSSSDFFSFNTPSSRVRSLETSTEGTTRLVGQTTESSEIAFTETESEGATSTEAEIVSQSTGAAATDAIRGAAAVAVGLVGIALL
ncbi:hypothetical protein M501DRAFT_1013257 [Patellaria atrata CBS 101060]|uniref:Uncharacterized protein n=1 Tax=Patellaria atrata CBS 101060 TaxID=1346257 RepID=A0A9P4VQF5_9PEZI|nr:hypothetical protein M501DRAFT_1013257 [Patellaria atrata CBS 101060]